MIKNPFLTYGYNGPEYFCDRVEETKRLTSLLVNGNHVALISPRRMGKAGLIRHCFAQRELQDNYYLFIIDIYATKSLAELTYALGRAILSELKSKEKKTWERFIQIVGSLREFEIIDMDANHLRLIYAAPGTGGWGEATWWAFTSHSDDEAALTNFDTKNWTWDTEFREDGAVWGNLGYAAGEDWTSGIWWGSNPEGLTGQLQHSDTGVATGEESADATMTFDWKKGKVTCYAADGSEIRSGNYSVTWLGGDPLQPSIDGSQYKWAYGTLTTDPGSILFPFQINSGGNKPTDFEIMQLDADHIKLIYAAPGTGSWSEATWWAFKAK